MALTVGTDSYITVEDATTYAIAYGKAFSGTTDALEAALRRATRWIDATYRSRFPGYRTDGRAQALEWPRTDATDASGEEIAVDEIPVEIENATVEAAVRELATPGSLSPDVVPGQTKTLTAVGSLRWTPTGQGGADAQKPVVAVVDGILAPLIGGKSNRLLRA
ncbi:hypothetical protein JF540_22910 [Salipiger thiooxidans]|uniref:DnaT-like ssDNA-binding protein n=1 Tax=Salipiger thiooxidans TaxID=282683 RepID=UPI001A8F308B|nr:DnaT-like ssDNA-binding protein [Salipiger thiooxidans]MBN8189540.1 hypothetical protein [Salipiger thiooxidans]